MILRHNSRRVFVILQNPFGVVIQGGLAGGLGKEPDSLSSAGRDCSTFTTRGAYSTRQRCASGERKRGEGSFCCTQYRCTPRERWHEALWRPAEEDASSPTHVWYVGGRRRGYICQTEKTNRQLMKHSTQPTKIFILSHMVQRK
jgi:hypothetical protein